MDKRARKILFDAYWGSGGWGGTAPSQADFDYAKAHALMFDPLTISEADLLAELALLVDAVDRRTLGRAFAASLTSRRCEWRSAMASHAHAGLFLGGQRSIWHFGGVKGEDVNVFNFERIKWGGVRHKWTIYNLFDLRRFRAETIADPAPEDVDVLRQLLTMIDESEAQETPGVLCKRLTGLFKSNEVERRTVLDILCCAGVMPGAADPERSDWNFAERWRGADGVDWDVADLYFGHLLS